MPVSHSHLVVTPGANARPPIPNELSLPAFCCLRVCCDQKISKLFLGQIKVRGQVGKGRKGSSWAEAVGSQLGTLLLSGSWRCSHLVEKSVHNHPGLKAERN